MKRTLDLEVLQKWLGKSEHHHDIITARSANFMAATLGQTDVIFRVGDELPLTWHWLYFLEAKPANQLGRDGHPALGGFLPPVALPRRMWAGARLEFLNPIKIGDSLSKTSTIKNVVRKTGNTGELCFVTVLHEIRDDKETLLKEEHDIVYREDPAPDAATVKPPAAPVNADMTKSIEPSSTTLFRYSALTFNGHRIHYDLDYARNVEGYPGLVFHAPLTATLIMEMAREQFGAKPIRHFQFRAVSPLFANSDFQIACKKDGTTLTAWASNESGDLAITAAIS